MSDEVSPNPSQNKSINPRPPSRKSVLQRVKEYALRLVIRWPTFTFAQNVADSITQHPELSFGGGAGVMYATGIGLEISGAPFIAAIFYLVGLLLLARALFQGSYFKSQWQRVAALLAVVAVTSAIYYALWPTPPPPPPTTKEIADELEKRILPMLHAATPLATPPPSPSVTPSSTPSPAPSPSPIAPKSRSKRPKISEFQRRQRLLQELEGRNP